MKTLSAIFFRFVRNLLGSVKDNLSLHAMAIVLTFVIAISGLDWFLNRLVAHRIMTPLDSAVTRPGMLVPAFGPIIVWVLGKLVKNETIKTTGLLLGQSAIIGFIVQSVYKAFTGRVPPYFKISSGEDFSLLFRFWISQRWHTGGMALGAHLDCLRHGRKPCEILARKEMALCWCPFICSLHGNRDVKYWLTLSF